jgi:hypothetical protein
MPQEKLAFRILKKIDKNIKSNEQSRARSREERSGKIEFKGLFGRQHSGAGRFGGCP